MGKTTEISWTATVLADGTTVPGSTFNPWWGCVKVSDGCKNCYASAFDKRVGGAHWGPSSERRFFGDKHWAEPLKWNRDAEIEGVRKKVFCASMADVFEDRDDLIADRTRLFELIFRTPNLDWQLLTKRPQNICPLIHASFIQARMNPESRVNPEIDDLLEAWLVGKPPENVWLGTSVENQDAADERIPELLKVPAAVRFLSCEPLLSAVDLRRVNYENMVEIDALTGHHGVYSPLRGRCDSQIHWVIIGGESGNGARPMEIEWARDLKNQCAASGTACFIKQLGGVRDKRHNIEEFPEDLRVRQFPKSIEAVTSQ